MKRKKRNKQTGLTRQNINLSLGQNTGRGFLTGMGFGVDGPSSNDYLQIFVGKYPWSLSNTAFDLIDMEHVLL